ncbi:hypothetical protein TDB9533_00417 [Thalassocella blandensis]|nr:hypothetical protein TDB9533_00417 [Thalassocella blandensis]
MKKAIFAGIVTTFVTSLAFASVSLSKDPSYSHDIDQDRLIDQLNLNKGQHQQVMAILQEGKEEKLRIMKDANEKIMQLQQEQQAKLQDILGPEGPHLIKEIKQEKVEKHRKKLSDLKKG